MANVFTRRNRLPRTTTLRDFCVADKDWGRPLLPRRARVLSPTRKCNPHPSGLVFQEAYNKDHHTFDIWNPDFVKIARRMQENVNHIDHGNFCSRGGHLPPIQGEERTQPVIHYDIRTCNRTSFQTPVFPKDVPHKRDTTRFAYTPYKAARGIVPNNVPPKEYKPVD